MYALARPPREGSNVSEKRVSIGSSLKAGRLTKKEALSLTFGAILVWIIGYQVLSGFPYSPGLVAFYVNSFLFVISFLLHEYAHKLVANVSGLWAEFRLSLIGVLLTIISIISPIFKIIAPGSTVIFGIADARTMGKVAVAGPLTNIIISAVLLSIIIFYHNGGFLIPSYYINTLIVVFNLIPFSILDGHKIFVWNKVVWGLALSYSLASLIYAIYVVGLIK